MLKAVVLGFVVCLFCCVLSFVVCLWCCCVFVFCYMWACGGGVLLFVVPSVCVFLLGWFCCFASFGVWLNVCLFRYLAFPVFCVLLLFCVFCISVFYCSSVLCVGLLCSRLFVALLALAYCYFIVGRCAVYVLIRFICDGLVLGFCDWFWGFAF